MSKGWCMKAKVNILAKPHASLHLFHTTVRQHPWDFNLLPSMQLLMLCISIWVYTLIIMTSRQPTQAQGLGCTRGMWQECHALSIQTYDNVVKVQHGFSLIPRQLVVRYRKTEYCKVSSVKYWGGGGGGGPCHPPVPTPMQICTVFG